MQLAGKNIILGITGSIASFKAATLCRLLVKQGATVKVVMTPLATQFVTPVTFGTLSKNTVLVDFFKHDDGTWNSHVDLGIWADLFVIAPASANTMAKMANGICDNLLLTTYLSVRCPVMVAPAMDMDMYKHPATQHNIERLKSFGTMFVEPDNGELASGLIGKGRMAEPELITQEIICFFESKQKLKGRHILVTAGPTYEPIDAVRFIGNYSSGKMGIEIAKTLSLQGAKVTLVLGPVSNTPADKNIEIIPVTTAEEMYKATIEKFKNTDGAILSAAVADFTPTEKSTTKIKRTSDSLDLKLSPTKDIAAHLGKIKKEKQFLVGFALETNNEEKNAKKKLKSKKLDFIVLNSLNDTGAGFGHDTNKITIFTAAGNKKEYPLKTKTEVAKDIVETIIEILK